MQRVLEKGFPFSPFQPLVFSFVQARRTMLSGVEQGTSRAKVWKGGVGFRVLGIGMGEGKGVQKAVWLVKLGGIGWVGIAKVCGKPETVLLPHQL